MAEKPNWWKRAILGGAALFGVAAAANTETGERVIASVAKAGTGAVKGALSGGRQGWEAERAGSHASSEDGRNDEVVRDTEPSRVTFGGGENSNATDEDSTQSGERERSQTQERVRMAPLVIDLPSNVESAARDSRKITVRVALVVPEGERVPDVGFQEADFEVLARRENAMLDPSEVRSAENLVRRVRTARAELDRLEHLRGSRRVGNIGMLEGRIRDARRFIAENEDRAAEADRALRMSRSQDGIRSIERGTGPQVSTDALGEQDRRGIAEAISSLERKDRETFQAFENQSVKVLGNTVVDFTLDRDTIVFDDEYRHGRLRVHLPAQVTAVAAAHNGAVVVDLIIEGRDGKIQTTGWSADGVPTPQELRQAEGGERFEVDLGRLRSRREGR